MKKFQAIALIFSILILTGCATVFKGYEDEVNILNAPEDLKVFTKDGTEIKTTSKTERVKDESTFSISDVNMKSIKLRSDKYHTLIFKSGGKEKTVDLYPKLGAGWLIIDIITVFPAFIDMYTGNWNYFDPVVLEF
ncbi:MAG: hypothetical protein IPM56_18040 [Ignavibacteriales bacterium]|nr:MAG: hypothetical protein IPM56_18040 [Ignavibacteriales bacterium]